MGPYRDVAAGDWQTWVSDNDAIVLDVREPNEWALGTLPDATLISLGELVSRMGELRKETPVLCVCRSGVRSANVARFLTFNGYEAANLVGGLKALGMQA